MAKTTNTRPALTYLQSLLENEYLQEQLREAAVGLRQAYGRAERKRAQATEDKQLYGSLRRAATSSRNAWMALRKPPPPPPKRRGRKILIIALAGCGAALLTRLGRHQQDSDTPPDTNGPSATATSTGDGSAQPETATSS